VNAFFIGAIFTSTVVAAIIIVSASIAFTIGSFFLVRRFLPSIRTKDNEFTTLVFTVVATLYAVLLGFVVVIAWQDFSDARGQTTTEVASVSVLLRDAGGFPPGPRREIRTDLINYLFRVTEDEYRTMDKGKADKTTEEAYSRIWDAFYAYEPKTDQEKEFYSTSVERLSGLAEARGKRILASQSKVPNPLWVLLIAGAVVTIIFTHLFWNKDIRAHLIGITILGGLLGLVIFLIFALQHPFSGDIRISPAPYKELAEEWANRPL